MRTTRTTTSQNATARSPQPEQERANRLVGRSQVRHLYPGSLNSDNSLLFFVVVGCDSPLTAGSCRAGQVLGNLRFLGRRLVRVGGFEGLRCLVELLGNGLFFVNRVIV